MEDFNEHKEKITEQITQTVNSRDVQPIIFAGTELSKRYFSAPSWDGLLEDMAEQCPKVDPNYGFFRQTRNEMEAGQLLGEKYAEWAWDKNDPKFLDDDILDYRNPQDIYLKKEVCGYLEDITPESVDDLTEETVDDDITLDQAKAEIDQLRDIQPHAVITTNYDQFLERIFNQDENESSLGEEGDSDSDLGSEEDRYNVVVGQEVLTEQYKSLGEILKIHGCVTDPESLMLTEEDYENFNSIKRYLSSKMLTYFVEHPLLIVGYSASDPNVQKILSWVNDVRDDSDNISEDIYFLKYESDMDERETFPMKRRIQIGDGRYVTVKQIIANDFEWVFEAFASGEGFNADIRYLRRLIDNMYEVVSEQDPRAKVVDHRNVESIAKDKDELATVLGVSTVGDEPGVQFSHEISPHQMAKELDIGDVNTEVIQQIYEDTEVNITALNNRYHVAFFKGTSSTPRRYSEDALELFEKVIEGEEYELNIPESRIPEEQDPDEAVTLNY
jgi:hypothetical protein